MDEDSLVAYEEEVHEQDSLQKDSKKGSYVGIHATGFKDLLLKPEITKAISSAGFEHPSEVQQQCIPQAILGTDVLCQAKSGMGKTAVFVISTLQQLEVDERETKGAVKVLAIAHTRELAYQISQTYERFLKHLPNVRCDYFAGGTDIREHIKKLEKPPHIVVGTPGRILQLVNEKRLDLSKVKYFVIDECDQVLEKYDMRKDVQQIFKSTPHNKQVMMFTATLPKDIRETCKKFMHNPLEIFIDDEKKLILHGLQQYYVKLEEKEKNRKLCDLLDALDFNQLIIFVKSVSRCVELQKLLNENSFPSICIHSQMEQKDRLLRYQEFKSFSKRIMVATELFGRGIDIERVNIVINYDMPHSTDAYLHRVSRAARFGGKGLAIAFVTENDSKALEDVQKRFEVDVPPLPASIDVATYMSGT